MASVDSFESEGRNWTPPAPTSNPAMGLHVYNSLSREKVPFVTRDGSNQVTWYTCGPTVYASSHLGHARNYVTFDIMRRIMEGYFGYNIFYVMNVTDVDDKIINRARRNYLLDRFRATANNPDQVTVEFEEAYAREHLKQRMQVAFTIEEYGRARSSRQLDEIANKVKQEELKLQKIEEAKGRFETLKREACDLGGKEGVEKLLSGGIADILASHLDVKGKASVTDHAIFRSHAARYEREFMDDMKSLGVQDPDVLTRVTEYIPEIIEYVEVILNHQLAYVVNNSVYFDTKAFRDAGHTYGKLSPWAVGSSELASESESNFETTEKRSSCDFALWKKSKEGEPAWKSPWGMGRPGWHIECSAMASDILGDRMDIHSGGHDLQFPHHDNELAQAEAYFNSSEWVRYFFHSGHLSIDGLKMSKSLKNFITIKEALQKYSSRQLRMLFVIHAWDKPINFSEAAVNEALGKEKQFKNFFSNVQVEMRQAALEGDQRWPDDEKQLQRRIQEVQSKVRVRLEDNFDTGGAVSELLLLVKDVHSYIDRCNSRSVKPRVFIIQKAALYVTRILSIFGLSDAGRGDIGFGSSSTQGVASAASLEVVAAPYLDAFAHFRDQVRTAAKEDAPKEKLLELADKVRDEAMVDLGVRFEDKGGKSTWKLDDPEVLQRERDEKIQKNKEKLLLKAVARFEHEERKEKAREQKLQRKQQKEGFLSEQMAASIHVKRLYPTDAKDDNKATFDVIFLPGLKIDAGTDFEKTWRNKDNILWPQEWLPQDLKKIRVFSLSYDAEPTKWFGPGNTEHVEYIGKNLLQSIVLGSDCIGSCPFALVGHSFGGLVIKALVNEARRSSGTAESNPLDGRTISKAKEFLKNLKLVVFYAVPHSAADAETFTSYVSERAASGLPKNMKPFSKKMAKMSVMMEAAFYNKEINIYAFGEGQPTYGGKMVVEPASAMQLAGKNFYILEDCDHTQVSKPANKEHPSYSILVDILRFYSEGTEPQYVFGERYEQMGCGKDASMTLEIG